MARHDLDVFADDAAKQLLHAGDDAIEREDARRDDLAPAEREQLLGQLGGAVGGLDDLVDVGAPRIAFPSSSSSSSL